MGLFRVLIYGIILSVYAGAIIYDIQFIPRIGSQWWIYKLVMLSMINFVKLILKLNNFLDSTNIIFLNLLFMRII